MDGNVCSCVCLNCINCLGRDLVATQLSPAAGVSLVVNNPVISELPFDTSTEDPAVGIQNDPSPLPCDVLIDQSIAETSTLAGASLAVNDPIISEQPVESSSVPAVGVQNELSPPVAETSTVAGVSLAVNDPVISVNVSSTEPAVGVQPSSNTQNVTNALPQVRKSNRLALRPRMNMFESSSGGSSSRSRDGNSPRGSTIHRGPCSIARRGRWSTARRGRWSTAHRGRVSTAGRGRGLTANRGSGRGVNSASVSGGGSQDTNSDHLGLEFHTSSGPEFPTSPGPESPSNPSRVLFRGCRLGGNWHIYIFASNYPVPEFEEEIVYAFDSY